MLTRATATNVASSQRCQTRNWTCARPGRRMASDVSAWVMTHLESPVGADPAHPAGPDYDDCPKNPSFGQEKRRRRVIHPIDGSKERIDESVSWVGDGIDDAPGTCK